MFNIALELFRKDSFVMVNKSLMKSLGIDEAILYGELMARYSYFLDRNMLDEEGFFFNTVDDLEDATCVPRKRQERAIKNLQSRNLIFVVLKGVPRKRFFKINTDVNVLSSILMQGKSNCKNNTLVTLIESQYGQNVPTGTDESTRLLRKKRIRKTENKNILIGHSNECPVDIPNSFPKKTSIFSELTQVYGKDRSEQMIEFVSTYIDDTYVELTGKQHKKELKAKRATFAKKLLEMTELFIMTFEELEELFETIIAEIDLDEVDPTIYYLTSSKVLGYWLLTTELVDFDMLRDTEYQPVEEMY